MRIRFTRVERMEAMWTRCVVGLATRIQEDEDMGTGIRGVGRWRRVGW
jgi:hypothetical protein